MKLGRVVGTVVSTINAPVFDDRTLLLCDLVGPGGEAAGGYVIAVDTVGAGAGETVLLLDEGTSARQILGLSHGPVRTLVVGIVDAVTLAAGEDRGTETTEARPAARAGVESTAGPSATAATSRSRRARRPGR